MMKITKLKNEIKELINGELCHAHELEDSILFRHLFFPI